MSALDASQDREGHEIDSGGRSESDDEFDQDSVAIGNLAAAARAKLADQLLASGRADAAVEAAFRGVPRHTFLPEMDQIQLSVGLETARLTAALLGRTRERQTRGTGWPQFLWVILWVVLRGQRPARALRVEPAAVPAHLAQQRPALHTPNEHGHATEETTMRAAFADDPVQTQAAEAQSQAECDAPRQALAPAATPETLARLTRRPQRITGLLRRRARPRATYYDPVFGRPDLIEDDYYRLRNQPRDFPGDHPQSRAAGITW